MDRTRLNDQLGVNKIGKSIKKSPLHQPNLPNGIIAPLRPPLHKIRPLPQPMMGRGDRCWSYTAHPPPVSVYMRYLQSSLEDSGLSGNQLQPQAQVHAPPQPPPRFNGSVRDAPILPTPRFNALPSPRFNGPGILPSPASQYLLQSPTAAYRNLLSRGVRYPSPLTPRSLDQPGILGPGTLSQPSPGHVSPSSSAYGLFPTL
ncbi:unnamed protein product [Microthlaspi erraticum]|uniref:VQ domain-containing protein n=1 Tax=Microthlaspi erraticum TaxID=1685480 RepID=A0A6D2IN96_9BRAS|nr:unnamed protein product [Microthlaspi erraticum]